MFQFDISQWLSPPCYHKNSKLSTKIVINNTLEGMEGNSHLKWNDHSAILLSKLHNMFEQKSLVDITLATDEGLSIQVHRIILCATSQYFEVR